MGSSVAGVPLYMAETLRFVNLRLIEALRKEFNIEGEGKRVHITAHPKVEQITALIGVIKKDIWLPANIDSVEHLLDQADNTSQRVLYLGANIPTDIQTFLARVGLLGSIILLPDQFAQLAYTNPEFEDSPENNPAAWIKAFIEWALYVCSLEDWVKQGIVYFIPPLSITNYKDWRALADSHEPDRNLDDEIIKYSILPTMVPQMRTQSGYIATFSKNPNLREKYKALLADDKALEEAA